MSFKLRNILLITMFLSICFLCDSFFFSNSILTILPYFTCNFEHSLGYYLYNTSEIYRAIYNHREMTTVILGCLYLLYFRVYIFQKGVSIIETKSQGLFLYDFLKELRKNKQILLYANIILLLLTLEMFHSYAQELKINYFFSFILFFPFHYLVLYIRWTIKDKNFKNKSGITGKYQPIQYINYIFLVNALMILFSSVDVFLGIFTDNFIFNLLSFTLLMLALIYIIYFSCYFFVKNTKLFLIVYSSVFLWIFLFMYFIFNEHYAKYLSALIAPLIIIVYILFLIGVISSLFINQLTKIITEKYTNN